MKKILTILLMVCIFCVFAGCIVLDENYAEEMNKCISSLSVKEYNDILSGSQSNTSIKVADLLDTEENNIEYK